MSRIRPIGDDDDECVDDGPQSVGHGCAEFVPTEADSGEQLRSAARFIARMRKMGATYVKLGDVEVQLGFPPALCKCRGGSGTD